MVDLTNTYRIRISERAVRFVSKAGVRGMCHKNIGKGWEYRTVEGVGKGACTREQLERES